MLEFEAPGEKFGFSYGFLSVCSCRTQLSAVQQEACERTDAAESLRRDLVGMQARMSDLVGELDDEQKREIEQLRLRVGKWNVPSLYSLVLVHDVTSIAHQEAVLRQREDDIQQLEGITRDQAKTMDTNRHEIERQQQLLELRLGETQVQGTELSRLADGIVTERNAKETLQRQLDETSQELTEMQMQYQNFERQQQVVERQKEAIQQLRDRMREMEELRPPSACDGIGMFMCMYSGMVSVHVVPGHEEALRQMVLLKRELNDLKTGDKRNKGTSTNESSRDMVTSTAMQTGPTTPVSLREATNALDRSEKSVRVSDVLQDG